jgi:hypothetical protein
MSTSRLYVSLVIAIVVCVLLSAGAAWGVSSLVLAGHTTHTVVGAAGANGKDGADGKNGAAGKDGATGATGATGAAGAKGAPGPANGPKGDTGAAGTDGTNGVNGTNGVDGQPGPPGLKGDQGDKGDKGDTGASAPTFSATPSNGISFLSNDTPQTLANLPDRIPAGAALVGFSLQITPDFFASNVTCELVNSSTSAVIDPGSPQTVSPGTPTLFSNTLVTTLPIASSLRVDCLSDAILDQGFEYTNVSIYAISFATS